MIDILVSLGIAIVVCFPAILFILIFAWYVDISVNRPLLVTDNYADLIVQVELLNFLYTLIYVLFTVPPMIVNAFFASLTTFRDNIRLIACLIILVGISFVWLEYHPDLLTTYTIMRQCFVRPIMDFFLLPVFNLICMVYDGVIACVNFYVNLEAFYWYGLPIILFKCAINQDLGTMIGYFTNVFRAFFFDMQQFLASNNYLYSDWNILNFLNELGLFIDTLVPIFTCFCSIVDFIYIYFSFFARLPALHYCLNCLWNVIIRLIQLPLTSIFYSPHKPSLVNLTVSACCAVESFGDTVQYTVYLIIEMLWGIVSGTTIGVLPYDFQQFLSWRYQDVITHPVCGIFKVVNMTNELFWHPSEFLLDTTGGGVAYLQFGFVFDEFRVAANALGTGFYIISNDIQALVTQLLLSVIDLVSFTVEWVIGNIFYFIYGGPLLPHYPSAPYSQPANFFQYYFPNYWLTPNSDVHLWFGDLKLAAEAAGSVIASITTFFVPIGCAIEHILKLVITAVEILFNLFSYIWPIITFTPDLATSFRAVNVDIFLNELYYTAGCLGNLFRQFDGATPCVFQLDDSQRNIVCAVGNLIETTLDVFIIAVQQMIHFSQDMITLPTGLLFVCIMGIHPPGDPLCVRIPDFTLALYELEIAICHFTDAVANVIPITAILNIFECIFPLPPPPPPNEPREPVKPCARITTCLSTFICRILKLFILPLRILNEFFIKTLAKAYFLGFTDFLQFSFDLVLRSLADVFAQFGTVLDCVLCAFSISSQTPNCDDTIYQIFSEIGNLLVLLATVFTTLFISVVKLFLTLFAGIFSGDPIKAIVKFVIGFFVEVLGGLGTTVVNFLVSLFDGLGLGFIGSFIKLLWKGFCFILQTTTNILIAVIKALTFGMIQVTFVDFCCAGGDCTPSGGVTKRNEDGSFSGGQQYGFDNGTLHVNMENWVYYLVTQTNISWPQNDACNASMTAYGENTNFTQLGYFEKGEVMFCLMKIAWNIRDDNQTELNPSMCDIMMGDLNTKAWFELREMEKATVMECMTDRIYMDSVRLALDIKWLPSDWLTNNYRKYVWAAEMSRGYIIYWQYYSDRESASAVILNPDYQARWATWNLNVSHYSRFNSSQDIVDHREKYHLQDYFEWNDNAPQYNAVLYTTTGFWNVMLFMIASVENTTLAFMDNVTDPTVYLNYDYTLDNQLSGFSSSINLFLHQILNGAKSVALWWSNPVNVKRRERAYTKLKDGGQGMYEASTRQIKMMGIEWYKDTLQHPYSVYTGQCNMSVNDTIEYMYNYEASLHGLGKNGETSYAYKLYEWWQKLNVTEMFTASPIANSRDPKYACRSCANHNPDYSRFQSSRVFDVSRLDSSFNQRAVVETNRRRAEALEKAKSEETYYTSVYKKQMNGHTFTTSSDDKEDDRRDFYQKQHINQTTLVKRLYHFYDLFTQGTSQSNRRKAVLSSIYTSMKNQFYFELVKYNLNNYDRDIQKAEGLRLEKLRYLGKEHEYYDGMENLFTVDTTTVTDDVIRRAKFVKHLHSMNRDNSSRITSRVESLHCMNPTHYRPDYLRSYVSLNEEKCHSYYDQSVIPSNLKLGDNDDKTKVETEEVRLYMDAANEIDREYRPFKKQDDVRDYRIINGRRKKRSFGIGGDLNNAQYKAADALITINGFITLTCASNISGLCQDCFYLDQLVGRVFSAINILVGYYTGGQYANTLNAAVDYFNYVFDENAYVIVGNGPANSIGTFPPYYTSLWDYLDDDTPNKIGFNDIINKTNELIANGSEAYENSTLYNQPIDTSSINGIVWYVWVQWFSPVIKIFYNMIFVSSTGGDAGEFLINWFILCDWNNGTDYLGTNKRFSLGQTMFMYAVTFFALWIIFVFAIGLDLWSFVTGTSLSLAIFFFTYLSITYNWSCLCWPGLPVQFMDDARYLFTYTIFPKCMYLFSGLVTSPYSNEYCYSCQIVSDMTMLNCVDDLGFKDIISNMVFMLEYYVPQVLQALRDTNTPFYIIYQIPYVNERLNQFAGINLQDPTLYARYMSCNYIITVLPNIGIMSTFLIGLNLFVLPYISMIISVFYSLGGLIYYGFLTAYYILLSMYMSLFFNAFALDGEQNLPTTPISGRNGDTPDNDLGGGGGMASSVNLSSTSPTSLSSRINSRLSSTDEDSGDDYDNSNNNDIVLDTFSSTSESRRRRKQGLKNNGLRDVMDLAMPRRRGGQGKNERTIHQYKGQKKEDESSFTYLRNLTRTSLKTWLNLSVDEEYKKK